MRKGFWLEYLREGKHFEDPGVDGRIILEWIFKKWNGGGGMDWTELHQNKDRRRALVNAVTNLLIP
jgi:hypothetical protein